MSLFDRLLGTVRGALEGYDLQLSDQLGHGPDCLCHRCVFVRGIRGELAAFAKSEAKAAKKRSSPLDHPEWPAKVEGALLAGNPLLTGQNSCLEADHYTKCPRFRKDCDAINCQPRKPAKAAKKRAK
jgi:hypothetical protein